MSLIKAGSVVINHLEFEKDLADVLQVVSLDVSALTKDSAPVGMTELPPEAIKIIIDQIKEVVAEQVRFYYTG